MLFFKENLFRMFSGEVAEWSIAADSKSVVLHWGTGGSNPSLSAI